MFLRAFTIKAASASVGVYFTNSAFHLFLFQRNYLIGVKMVLGQAILMSAILSSG